MESKIYKYSRLYKFSYIPGFIFILIFLYMVYSSPAVPGTEIYGYLVVLIILVAWTIMFILERRKVAKEIVITDAGIHAKSYYFFKDVFIEWNEVESLELGGFSLWLISGKIKHTNLYASVAGKEKAIVFRKEISNYDNLIESIQTKVKKNFTKAA